MFEWWLDQDLREARVAVAHLEERPVQVVNPRDAVRCVGSITCDTPPLLAI